MCKDNINAGDRWADIDTKPGKGGIVQTKDIIVERKEKRKKNCVYKNELLNFRIIV